MRVAVVLSVSVLMSSTLLMVVWGQSQTQSQGSAAGDSSQGTQAGEKNQDTSSTDTFGQTDASFSQQGQTDDAVFDCFCLFCFCLFFSLSLSFCIYLSHC